jgi:hypothetical protein
MDPASGSRARRVPGGRTRAPDPQGDSSVGAPVVRRMTPVVARLRGEDRRPAQKSARDRAQTNGVGRSPEGGDAQPPGVTIAERRTTRSLWNIVFDCSYHCYAILLATFLQPDKTVAERNQQVLEHVREQLGANPQLGSRELYASAQEVDRGIGGDSLQQFHARYVLPVKREQGAGQGGASGRRSGAKRPKRPRKDKAQPEQPAAQEAAASAKPRRARAQAVAGADRDRIRAVLLEFARDFSGAESRSEIVQVLSRMDEYVDRIASGG